VGGLGFAEASLDTLADLVALDHIVVAAPQDSPETVIRSLAARLAATDHVDAGYADACVAREATDPTGLPTAGAAVAIPHADPDLVRRSAVAVAVPRRPIAFAQMGDPEVQVMAEAVFLLALTGAQEQLAALRQVASLVQDAARLRSLVRARAPEDVRAVIIAHGQEGSS
jgi:galactitol PTS system EIIA component